MTRQPFHSIRHAQKRPPPGAMTAAQALDESVKFEAEVYRAAGDLVIAALATIALRQSPEDLARLADELDDPREHYGANLRAITARERDGGLTEQAKEQAGRRLREIIRRHRAEGSNADV